MHIGVSGGQKSSFQEDVINSITVMAILERRVSKSSEQGSVLQVTEGKSSKEMKDEMSRHSFKKYDKPKKEHTR